MALLATIRNKAALGYLHVDEQTIRRQASKEAPSVYKMGDNVLVQFERKRWNKVKGKGVGVIQSYPGEVVDCNLVVNWYKVKAILDGK